MPEKQESKKPELRGLNFGEATSDEIEEIKNKSDEELIRMAGSADMISLVETMRRLKNALHREEVAIKWLSVIIVVLTIIIAWKDGKELLLNLLSVF